MKILILSTNADEAGAPRHVETIVTGLKSSFEFVTVFGEKGPVSERLESFGHTIHIINEISSAISPVKDLIAIARLTKLIAVYDPDIIHCHSSKAGTIGRISAFLKGKKWIYTVHGWGWRGQFGFKKIIIILLEKIMAFIPKGFYVFVAKDVMNDGLEVLNLNEQNGCVIYNGVREINSAILSSHPMVILMPARVSSAKDHETLIKAFEKFDEESTKLLLCGAGTNSPGFISKTKILAPKNFKNISFLGQRSNMDEIYSQCNVVALISHFEALPLTIIEAMSCARGIIATNVGGVSELIENGVNGMLVEPGSIDDIVDALTNFKNLEFRAKMGLRARNFYNQKFTKNMMLDNISTTYKSMVNRNIY